MARILLAKFCQLQRETFILQGILLQRLMMFVLLDTPKVQITEPHFPLVFCVTARSLVLTTSLPILPYSVEVIAFSVANKRINKLIPTDNKVD